MKVPYLNYDVEQILDVLKTVNSMTYMTLKDYIKRNQEILNKPDFTPELIFKSEQTLHDWMELDRKDRGLLIVLLCLSKNHPIYFEIAYDVGLDGREEPDWFSLALDPENKLEFTSFSKNTDLFPASYKDDFDLITTKLEYYYGAPIANNRDKLMKLLRGIED